MTDYLRTVQDKRSDTHEQGQKNADKSAYLGAISDSGDKIVHAVNQQGSRTRTNVQKVKLTDTDLAKTKDIATVVAALKQLGDDTRPENIDWNPLLSALQSLGDKLDTLPKAFPDAPEPVEDVKVTNLKELSPDLKAIVAAVKALKLDPTFDPKIEVLPAPVKVTEQKVDIAPIIKAVSSLTPLLKALNKETVETDLTPLQNSIEKTTKAINSLSFPVPNYVLPFRTSDSKATQALLNDDGSVSTSSPSYALRLDDTTTTNVTYVGKAAIGSAVASAVWQVQKIDETSGMVITWADGNASFDNVWNNRASLTYS